MTDSYKLALRIRKHVLRMTSLGKSSHIGSVFSCVDILATLYSRVMKVLPTDPRWSQRDRFVMSKGHAGAGLYATLAECGFFPIQRLDTHCQNGSNLCGHVATHGIPGIEFSTGSLGHGLPVAAGMAFALRSKSPNVRIFALLSDGELDEGSNWEAFLFASHHQLKNLCVVVDYNKIQSLASVGETLGLEPLRDKFEAFGWEVRECDGHNHDELMDAFIPTSSKQPLVVMAHTVKGKGVSFMEHSVLWHYRSPQGEEMLAAMAELDGSPHA